MYDPEVPTGYQDADIEMRQLSEVGNTIARAQATNGRPFNPEKDTWIIEDAYWSEAGATFTLALICEDYGIDFDSSLDALFAYSARQ